MTLDVGILAWFFAAGTLFLLLLLVLLASHPSRSQERIAELSGEPRKAPPLRGAAGVSALERGVARRLKREARAKKMRERIVQAGLYGRGAGMALALARGVSMALPLLLGLALGVFGLAPLWPALALGGLVGLAGMLAPSFWLDHVKRSRQRKIRRALPDVLDVISICLEGGMSLPAALARVAREMTTAHPQLALELAIVEREMRMGMSAGEAMRAFAGRFDLEELRSLAAVITQAEQFGSSVTHALAVYSDTIRLKRHQHAEEMAQKAAIKILFPTLFCIFPGIFVVILGPAAIQIYETIIKGRLGM